MKLAMRRTSPRVAAAAGVAATVAGDEVWSGFSGPYHSESCRTSWCCFIKLWLVLIDLFVRTPHGGRGTLRTARTPNRARSWQIGIETSNDSFMLEPFAQRRRNGIIDEAKGSAPDKGGAPSVLTR